MSRLNRLRLMFEANGFDRTSSVDRIHPNSIVLAQTLTHFVKVAEVNRPVAVLTNYRGDLDWLPNRVYVHKYDDAPYIFACLHNEISGQPAQNKIDSTAQIDSTAKIGSPGLRIVQGPGGERVQLKHIGNVEIEANVIVGPGSIVHRSVFDSTILRTNVIVGSLCNIGHNVEVAEDSIITVSVSLGGSSRIGRRCWLGMGVMVRNGIRVCNDVLLGTGAVVVKNIDVPGKYVGNPAERIGAWDGRW